MLQNFVNLSLASPIEKNVSEENESVYGLLDLKLSMVPTLVPENNYDFTLSLNDPDLGFLGIEGRDLRI